MPKMISDQEKIARFRAFWTRSERDRALIGATIATFPSVRTVRREAGLVEPDDLDTRENLKELDEEWEAWREVMGDAMFVANPLWAFPWMAYETIRDLLHAAAGTPTTVPGAVACMQSAGNLLDWHPHVHLLISWGLFRRDGSFIPVEGTPDPEIVVRLFRHKVLRMVLKEGAIPARPSLRSPTPSDVSSRVDA